MLLVVGSTLLGDTFTGMLFYGLPRAISHRNDLAYQHRGVLAAIAPRNAHQVVMIVLVVFVARFVGAIAQASAQAATVRHFGSRVTRVVIGWPVFAAFTARGVRVELGPLPTSGGISWRPTVSPTQAVLLRRAGAHIHAVVAAIAAVAASQSTGSAAYLLIAAAAISVDAWWRACLIRRAIARKAAEGQGKTVATEAASLRERLGIARRQSDNSDPGPALALLEQIIASPQSDPIRRDLRAEHAMHLCRAGRFAEAAREFSEIASAATTPAAPAQAPFDDDTVCETAFDDDREAIAASSRQGWADAVLCAALCDDRALDPSTLERCAAILECPTYLSPESYAAHQHSMALLRIAQGRPAEAVTLIRQSREQVRAAADRAIVDATMAIALADLGEAAQARLWLDQAPPRSALWRAASARLAAAEKRAAPSWAR